MSAQITIEPRTVERIACYVDALGYTLCAACYHAGTSRPCERSRDLSGSCDRCGALLARSIELVDVSAVIEHVPVRIF